MLSGGRKGILRWCWTDNAKDAGDSGRRGMGDKYGRQLTKKARQRRPYPGCSVTFRYPTLQRVAHTLPKDPKYRDIVAHAIRVLERSRGWDFEDKVKAINTLVEVYNELPPSMAYERMLDEAFPVFRGLKYIRSLTTQKPLTMRLAKKK